MSNSQIMVTHYCYQKPLLQQKQIQIDKFKKLCEQRLKLLREINDLYEFSMSDDLQEEHGDGKKSRKEEQIRNLSQKIYENQSLKGLNYDSMKDDNISHYLLKISYCRTDELIEWFVKQEKRLFKARIQDIGLQILKSSEGIKEDLNENLNIQAVQDEIWIKYQKQIQVACQQNSQASQNQFYQLPFQYVPFLVSKNNCFLHKGIAIIYGEDLKDVFVNNFAVRLKDELKFMQKNVSQVLQDKRIGYFVVNLDEQQFGEQYKFQQAAKGKLSLKEIEPLLKRGSMPLCMKELMDYLKVESHLKHMGRQQLGLFLKGAGLPLQECLVYFKKGFSGKFTSEDFEKHYAYNIRHNYGKEGKKADYTPMSCSKVMGNTPGNGEYHGCPFRYMNKEQLTKSLKRNHVKDEFINEIVKKAAANHYQIACRKTFAALHPGVRDEVFFKVGNHPNKYLDCSREYYGEVQNDNQKGNNSNNNDQLNQYQQQQNQQNMQSMQIETAN